MFDIPESDIVGVRIDEETVRTNKCPEYIYARSTTSTDNAHENSLASIEIKNVKAKDNKISIPTG